MAEYEGDGTATSCKQLNITLIQQFISWFEYRETICEIPFEYLDTILRKYYLPSKVELFSK